MSDNALSLLRAIEWLPASSPLLSRAVLEWLMEENSMTKRFEGHCRHVTVEPLRESFVTADDIAEELPFLPQEPRYWLREIILSGDGVPWLAGRTVVPESTLNGPESVLSQLGSRPLGRYLFSSSTLRRDFINPGIVAGQWGRRSRLRLSGKPLLLTELFLPASPLYQSLSGESRE